MELNTRNFFAAAALLLLASTSEPLHAQFSGSSEIRTDLYRLDPGFFKLPPGRAIGSTAGITVDRDGRSIWVFDRCAASDCVGSSVAPISKFDAAGNWLMSFGTGMFIRPHGIHVDADGNVWVTDGEGPNGEDPRRNGKGHQVFKFSPQGKLLMTLGTAGVAGDGHGRESNARVVKFSSDGKFLKAWGKKGTAPGDFNTPHALALDSRGRLFVGDRGNNRIQIFDQDGNFLEEWTQFGNPSGMYIDGNDTLYVSEIGMNPAQGPDWRPGIRIGSAVDGRVTAFIGEAVASVSSQEGVSADAAGNVYGSLTGDMQIRRYVRR